MLNEVFILWLVFRALLLLHGELGRLQSLLAQLLSHLHDLIQFNFGQGLGYTFLGLLVSGFYLYELHTEFAGLFHRSAFSWTT